MNLDFCKLCKQRIMWVTTVNGKNMCVDSLAYIDGNVIIVGDQARVLKKDEQVPNDVPRFKVHQATCSKYRKTRRV